MTPLCCAAWLVALIVLPVLIILWATESQDQRIRRFKRQYGLSERVLAKRFGVTRHRVRVALA